MSFENFPYSNFHELNLDWIVQKLKEAYSSENPPNYPVKSVNGMTGDVIIAIPSNFVQSVNGETGDVVLYRNPLTQFPATDEVRWNLFRICDGTEKGIEFDADSAKRIAGTRRILIYDEDNPPDYPVTSVNGQTGDVQITAGVQSVNGKTGNVVTPFVNPNTDILTLDSNSPSVLWGISRNVAGGNVALYITTGGTNPQAFIRYIPEGGQAINLPLLTNVDIPESAGVVSVNSKTGSVTLYGTDILLSESNTENITSTLLNAINQINNALNQIDNIKNAVSVEKTGEYFTWKLGYYDPINGNFNATNPRYIVTNVLTTDQLSKIINIRTEEDLKICIFGWSNNEFAGLYNKSTNTFVTSNVSEQFFDTEFDVSKILNTFQNYSLAFEVRAFPLHVLELTEAENVILTIFNNGIDIDISAITDELAEHETRIEALETNDSAQDQDITALQAKDNTQDQQISALQSIDTTHAQQIAELYTKIGAGIKEVKFTDVVSLPIRYPETGTDADITENMACMNAILSRPGVQRTNLTIVFYNGYLTISGTIQGMTDIILYLTKT